MGMAIANRKNRCETGALRTWAKVNRGVSKGGSGLRKEGQVQIKKLPPLKPPHLPAHPFTDPPDLASFDFLASPWLFRG